MFKNIIVASDLSPKAIFSARKAVQIAHQFNSNITVLNVHEEFMDKDEMEMLRVSVDDMQDKFRQIAIEAKNEIKSMFSKLHTDDIKIEVILREGTPSKEILILAKEINADLIVMGTNGKDNLTDFLLGTTSENVISKSSCSVLVVPIS
jgi:nucleotide-binding universal stress UspA family protein